MYILLQAGISYPQALCGGSLDTLLWEIPWTRGATTGRLSMVGCVTMVTTDVSSSCSPNVPLKICCHED